MNSNHRSLIVFLLIVLAWPATIVTCAELDLSGVWKAYRNFGPEVRGELVISRTGNNWQADVAGYSFTGPLVNNDQYITFELPGNRGRFEGHLKDKVLRGHWTQPAPIQIGMKMSSPVHFTRRQSDQWFGLIAPRESEFTFYLPITKGKDGNHNTFLRNPDRNLGVFNNIKHIVIDADQLKFVGPSRRSDEEQTYFEGLFHASDDYFTVTMSAFRGGAYDFHRIEDLNSSQFYARGKSPLPYTYSPPLSVDDGWKTATLEDVRIQFEPLKEMIEKEIDPGAVSVNDLDLHGVLIARHGKLVFEQYFHGMHRTKPHDTRSASKSMASLLVGASMQAGMDVSPETSVFNSLLPASKTQTLDDKKKSMKLEHLLTMSSGFYCDDNDNNAPGNENTMQEQEDEPDWYQYTLALPMADAPGQKAIYCSANTNLIGAVLSATTERSVRELFASYIAQPLDIKRYYLGLQPTGEVYLGGGSQWLPRDFMKIGQLMLNKGTWNGKRIVSKQWVEDSIAKQVEIEGRGYGYQWWIVDYPYKDRTVRAFFAGGNGGQVVMGIPELDLLVALFGGNYSHRKSRYGSDVLIPDYILKAVEE